MTTTEHTTRTATNRTATNRTASNRTNRRFRVAVGVLAATIALGACSTGAADPGATSGSDDGPTAGSTGRRAATETDAGAGTTNRQVAVTTSASDAGPLGATRPTDGPRLDLEEVTDDHGETTLVPRVRFATTDDPGSGSTRSRVFHRQGEAATEADTGNWGSMYEFIEFVIQANDSYWTPVFTENGLAEPMVNYIIPEPGVVHSTVCDGGVTDDNSMFYCGADDTIFFSQAIATRLWDGSYVGPDGQSFDGQVGDYATALLVSHEFAHSIQAELGYTMANVSVPMLEQHADCWAGVFTSWAHGQGMLDANDLNEGVIGAFLVGDSHFDSPTHHGTAEDRIIAFATGFNGGTPTACNGYLGA